jgi:hypothetical protein
MDSHEEAITLSAQPVTEGQFRDALPLDELPQVPVR